MTTKVITYEQRTNYFSLFFELKVLKFTKKLFFAYKYRRKH